MEGKAWNGRARWQRWMRRSRRRRSPRRSTGSRRSLGCEAQGHLGRLLRQPRWGDDLRPFRVLAEEPVSEGEGIAALGRAIHQAIGVITKSSGLGAANGRVRQAPCRFGLRRGKGLLWRLDFRLHCYYGCQAALSLAGFAPPEQVLFPTRPVQSGATVNGIAFETNWSPVVVVLSGTARR